MTPEQRIKKNLLAAIYREKHREEIRERDRLRYKNNKLIYKKQNAINYAKIKDTYSYKQTIKKYQEDHKDRKKQYDIQYRKDKCNLRRPKNGRDING